MPKHEHPIKEPYWSDFEEPLTPKREKEKPFDFESEPGAFQLLLYLDHKGVEYRSMGHAMAYLKEQVQSAEDPKEREWVKKLINAIESFGRKPEKIQPASEGFAKDWLERQIKEKTIERIDAARSSDTEMAKYHEEEEQALSNLLENISQGKWSNIDLKSKQEFSLASWLKSAELDLKNEIQAKASPQRIKKAKQKLEAWQKIQALIHKNQ